MPKKGSARPPIDVPVVFSATKRSPQFVLNNAADELSFGFVPKGEQETFWLDCSKLLMLPNCAVAFAKAISLASHGRRRATGKSYVNDTCNGFVAFCRYKGMEARVRPQDIDTVLLNAFVIWLGEKREDGSFLRSPNTRMHLLGTMRTILSELEELGVTLADDHEVPTNPWPLASREEPRRGGVDEVTTEELMRFYRYCKDGIAERMRIVERGWAEEAAFRDATPVERKNAHSGSLIRRGSVIIRAKSTFGVALPERQQLKNLKHELFDEIESYGYRDLVSVLAPYAADLCPFVYYLLFVTGFNQQPLVDILVDDVQIKRSLGREVVKIASVKNKALSAKFPNGKPIRSSFVISPDRASPGQVLHFLLQWTAFLRSTSSHSATKRLFTFVPRNRPNPGALDTYAQAEKGRTVFERHTTSFCKQGNFSWVGPRRIRNVSAEVADYVAGGNVKAASTFLHHSRTTTTQQHYQNAAVLTRQDQRLAQGMSERERWVNSKGRVEPRNVDRRRDRSAATPGFRCIDPTESPLPGQTRGRLCVAYGECPSCPLAMVDLRNTYTAACLSAMKERFEERRVEMGAHAFEVRWGDNYRSLTRIWMPAFSGSVVEESRRVAIPALPDLE